MFVYCVFMTSYVEDRGMLFLLHLIFTKIVSPVGHFRPKPVIMAFAQATHVS